MRAFAEGITRGLVLVVVGWLLGGAVCHAQTGVEVQVTPATQTIAVDEMLDLFVVVPGQADVEFNTYGLDVVVGSGLQLVDVKEGSYFPSICGSTYFAFATPHVTHTLLCYQTFVQGPGQLCKITVKGVTAGTWSVGLANVHFYRAGYPVALSTVTGASVTVSGGGGGGGSCGGCELEKPAAHSTWTRTKELWKP